MHEGDLTVNKIASTEHDIPFATPWRGCDGTVKHFGQFRAVLPWGEFENYIGANVKDPPTGQVVDLNVNVIVRHWIELRLKLLCKDSDAGLGSYPLGTVTWTRRFDMKADWDGFINDAKGTRGKPS